MYKYYSNVPIFRKYLLYILKKCSYWNWILPIFEPYNRPNLSANLLYFVTWVLTFAQMQLNVLLSLNRFICIIFPQFYRIFWAHRRFTFGSIFALFLIAFALALPMLWMPICFQTSNISVIDSLNVTTTIVKVTGPVYMNIADLVFFVNIVNYSTQC